MGDATRVINENTPYQRTGGAFDVSIATSLALEGLMGTHPDNPVKPPPINRVNELWINIATILRNIYNSVLSENELITADDLFYILHSELIYIHAKLGDSHPNLKVRFYAHTVKEIEAKYKNIKLKKPNTPKQQVFYSLLDRTLNYAINTLSASGDVRLERLSESTTSAAHCVAILTHQIVDLVSLAAPQKSSDKVMLLESHTGRLKTKAEWGTKVSSNLGAKLPLTLFTLQVFGDTSGLVQPLPLKHRRVIVEFAEKERWSAITTEARMRYAVGSIGDKQLKEELMLCFN